MADAIACQWDAGAKAFVPAARFVTTADEKFVGGAVYWLSVDAERTEKTHNHEFAWISEAWKNLPEHLADLFPSSEHLRKRALIDCGHFHETVIDCGSNAAALRVASYARAEDGFALVIVRGPVVVIRKAKSQSRRAMGAADFQKSKQDILDLISGMLGVTPEQLTNARAA